MKYHKDRKKTKGLSRFIESHNRRVLDSLSNNDEIVGKEISLKIEAIGSKGDGIAKYKSYTAIVPDTKVNEQVDVIVQDIKGNILFAELKK